RSPHRTPVGRWELGWRRRAGPPGRDKLTTRVCGFSGRVNRKDRCDTYLRFARATRQSLIRLPVFLARLLDHARRQLGRRPVLVPRRRFQPVTHELLVERRRTYADAIFIRGPEARAVRRQHLVDQDDLARWQPAPLELRIGQDDAMTARMLGGA